MEMQYFKDYSPALGRDMECKIYGHAGRRDNTERVFRAYRRYCAYTWACRYRSLR